MAEHFMVDHLVGPVIMKLIEACHLYLKDQVRWQTGMNEELQSLQDNLPHIQAVLSVYSQVEIKESALNKWYWQLRDAIDEADDVLDEFDYWKLEKSIPKRFYKFFERAFKTDPMLKKLEAAVHKLHKISVQVSALLHLLKSTNQEQQQQQLKLRETRETGSMSSIELLGRRKEMEFVRQWLRKSYETAGIDCTDSYRNISVLSVVGHGGMGKTTLLQHAYEDEMMKEFDVKMWVCVSTNFKAKTVIVKILRSLKKQLSFEDTDTLEPLQRSLQSEVVSKKFLLVLDDIWEDDESEWRKVLDPLSFGSWGSKILITTRMNTVVLMFLKMIKKGEEVLRLEGLKEEECFRLLSTHAFAGVNPNDELTSIAGKIVQKLSGCPFAAKFIGGILNSNIDKSSWIKVLNANIGKVGQDQNHLMPVLKLSYTYLPKSLQNCFSFCSIFPQDYEFDKDDLVRMWIALGFIKSSNIQEDTLEDTGRRYFNILAQKSFFDEFRKDYGGVYYKMHDLLHELAQFVSEQECCRIEDDRAFSIPETTRHLSFTFFRCDLKAASKEIGKLKNLRSLILTVYFNSGANVINEILKATKSIRLFVIRASFGHLNMQKIGCLIHLRYFKFDNWTLNPPRSISHLYHLKFISFKQLPNLEMDNIDWEEVMPNENCQFLLDSLYIEDLSPTRLIAEPLRRISSIRFLTIWKDYQLVSFPTETEQWFLQLQSSLSELRFQSLQSLKSLPSSLRSLSSLKDLEVSQVPQLKLLPNPPASLATLTLLYLESLQCLPSCLHTRLRVLTINEAPRLLELPDLPFSLVKLDLEKLRSLKCLPSSLSAISSLKTLKLINIPRLKSLPDLPSSLEYLFLVGLENLNCLPSCLPTLIELGIYTVPQLLELPDLPASLKHLNIRNCHPQLMERYHRGRKK